MKNSKYVCGMQEFFREKVLKFSKEFPFFFLSNTALFVTREIDHKSPLRSQNVKQYSQSEAMPTFDKKSSLIKFNKKHFALIGFYF